MVLTDPMVDPRGGALTLGLGMVDNLTVVPHFGDEHDDAHGAEAPANGGHGPGGAPGRGPPGPDGPHPGQRRRLAHEGAGAGVFVGAPSTGGLGALKG